MGYNLWLSEDAAYTLGRRLTPGSRNALDRPEAPVDAGNSFDMAQAQGIDALLDKLALLLDGRHLESC